MIEKGALPSWEGAFAFSDFDFFTGEGRTHAVPAVIHNTTALFCKENRDGLGCGFIRSSDLPCVGLHHRKSAKSGLPWLCSSAFSCLE